MDARWGGAIGWRDVGRRDVGRGEREARCAVRIGREAGVGRRDVGRGDREVRWRDAGRRDLGRGGRRERARGQRTRCIQRAHAARARLA